MLAEVVEWANYKEIFI